MRKIITFVFLVVSMQAVFAQSKNVDSLKNVLSKTTGQLERFRLINEIFEGIFINGNDNLDSASCIEMLAIAQELNNDSLLATSYNMVAGYFFINTGDNTTALEYLFKAIPLAEFTQKKFMKEETSPFLTAMSKRFNEVPLPPSPLRQHSD